MAKKKLNLQAYQQDILARLKSLADGGQAPYASKLGVKIGGSNWLVSLGDINEVLPVPDVMRVPLTRSWFVGMANVRGNLYAITDLASFAGMASSPINMQSRILLAGAHFGINAGLLVERLIGLRNPQDMQIQEVVESKPEWQLARYQDASGENWDELDIGRLLSQNDFMQIAA